MLPTPSRHVPVLPIEVLKYLDPQPGQTIVDCTVGGGGHARLIAEQLGPQGCLIGLDQDEEAFESAKTQLTTGQSRLVHANFEQLRQVLDELKVEKVDAVLADLGVSSDQLDASDRGLSFQQPGPLDMRLDRSAGQPASALIAQLNERDLADIFWRLGEERFSRRVARRIVEVRQERPLQTTQELAELVRRCVPRSRGHGIDPATRVFQALRIAVNDELGALERLLKTLPRCLKLGGRAVIISFHSLEDRLVKRSFRNRELWQELTRKPVQAQEDETRVNPRARSAKLRAAVLKPDETGEAGWPSTSPKERKRT